jgi:RNA polymerase sigma factor (sigma-70 family)
LLECRERRPPTEDPTDTTQTLVRLAAEGNREAADALFVRYAPAIRRWAHGRLPRWARDIADTNDLVQETLLQTFRNLHRFDYRGQGALHAYLRQGVMNGIREELRRHARRPAHDQLDSGMQDDGTSPLDAAVGQETVARYESALAGLTGEEREAIVARLELGLTHQEIADALGKPSADAARMMVARAMVQLARGMDRD